MPGQHAERRRAIEAALLDFHRAPGRHTVALRQPALLFASIREVLQFATDRTADDAGPPPEAQIVQAARFFVRRALLEPDADYYTLLGLASSAEAAAIKERYRLLMRLTHPDFSASPATGAVWPADAATRINAAYEVLSSPDRRRTYDEERAGPAPSAPTAKREVADPRTMARSSGAQSLGDSRQVLRWLAMGFGAAGGVALLGMWFATAQGDRESLVQRATTRVTAADKLPDLFGEPGLSPAPNSEHKPLTAPQDDSLASTLAAALPAMLSAPAQAPPTAVTAVAPSALTLPTSAPATATATAPTVLAVSEPAAASVSPASPPAASAAPAPAPTVQVNTVTPIPAPTAPVATAPPPPVAAPMPAPVPTPAPAPVVVQAAPAAPPAAASARAAPSAPSMADVHPMLMQLLTELESGWGDNVISILDRGARSAPGAQALARQVDSLCEGVRPVKIGNADFRGEARDGRLFVTGRIAIRVRDAAAPTRNLALQAEFALQGGAPVLTRLSLP